MQQRLLDPEIVLANRRLKNNNNNNNNNSNSSNNNKYRIGSATPQAPKVQPSYTVDFKQLSSAPTSPNLSDDEDEDNSSCQLGSAMREKLQPTLEQVQRARSLLQLQRQPAQQQERQLMEADVPALIFLGDRQSGKTSLLSTLCGLQLSVLAGTLCPVRLQLQPAGSWSAGVSFSDSHGKTISWDATSREDLQQAVRLAQERIAGPKARVTKGILTVQVAAPGFPSLICYDLPPVSAASADGDLDKGTEIARQTIEQHPNAVIVLVMALNVDPSRWFAHRLASGYDTECGRVVSALTFSDKVSARMLEQRLTEARQQLSIFRKDFVVVRLPSSHAGPIPTSGRTRQQSAKLAIAEEAASMMRDPVLSQMDRQQLGSPALSAAIADAALIVCKSFLPDLLTEISISRDRVMQELHDLGPAPPSDDRTRVAIIAKLFNDFVKNFQVEADGSVIDNNYELDKSKRQLSLHQRCRQHWRKLAQSMEQTASRLGDSGDQLRDSISSFLNDERGYELLNFQSTFPIVESIIRQRLLQPLKQLSIACLREVALEVDVTLRVLADHAFAGYPHLCQYVKECTQELKERMVLQAKEDLERQFEQEGYVWASDTAFMRDTQGRTAMHRLCRSMRVRPGPAAYSFANEFSQLAIHWLCDQCCGAEETSVESFRAWFLANFSSYLSAQSQLESENGHDDHDDHGDDNAGTMSESATALALRDRQRNLRPDDDTIMESAIEKSLDSLHTYIRLAVTRIMDKAPLCMMHHLLYKMSDELQNEVSVYHQDSESLDQLLQEKDGVGERRLEAKRRMRLLLEAEAELSKAAL